MKAAGAAASEVSVSTSFTTCIVMFNILIAGLWELEVWELFCRGGQKNCLAAYGVDVNMTTPCMATDNKPALGNQTGSCVNMKWLYL